MFVDKKKRRFVQYKEWCIDNMGEPVKDLSMELKRPPLVVNNDIDKHIKTDQILYMHIMYNKRITGTVLLIQTYIRQGGRTIFYSNGSEIHPSECDYPVSP